MHRRSTLIWGTGSFWILCAGFAAAAEPALLDYNRDIKPILSNACFRCHGPDQDERKGGPDGLRLDTAEGASIDLGGHRAIVPGQPDDSELLARVLSTDPSEMMPPPKQGKHLSQQEIETLRTWIAQGAKYQKHWSYLSPTRPAVPPVRDTAWPRNDVDRFLLHRLEREGLTPQPEADRYALIRRVSLDLTGLPPTWEEADAFAKDPDPLAYDKLVDRLLTSPAYGEHWAHQWLDLARYADSAGYADDPARTIWLYRDYVIKSFNANKPFDQFTIEQIAGDLLPNPTEEQLIATAFHRNTLTNNEGGTNDEEFRSVAVVDRVNTTLAVWMGTTIACAQCHTHKYDPLTQAEFFQIADFFNSTEDADRGDESPLLSVYTAEQREQKSQFEQQLAKLQTTLQTSTPELAAAQQKWEQELAGELPWMTLQPSAASTKSGKPLELADEGRVFAPETAVTDTYTVTLPVAAESFQALRLEALPHEKLPAQGPGHAGGNFVLTKVSATLVPPESKKLTGRYVRIELPGQGKFLSLAEVQVMQGETNLALKGQATQSSTDFEGVAQRAIDGNTEGRFFVANSVTHTAAGDNPWWEVDLQSAQELQQIRIWNRLDNVEGRLQNFKVLVLNEQRETVWEQIVTTVPNPSLELSVTGVRTITFTTAVADYSQSTFEPANVLNNPDPAGKGWAVGGQLGQPHALTLVAAAPVAVVPGSQLVVVLEQNSRFENHTLGNFRLSVTNDPRAAKWGSLPGSLLASIRKPAADRTPTETAAVTQHFLAETPLLAETRAQRAEVEKSLAALKPVTVPILRELAADKRRKTHIQLRGNFMDLGDEVRATTPVAFPPLPTGVPVDRLALARWLIADENPLTARVIANRYWEQLFGIGIVATSEEFGSQGDLPFHPELLDYLATELQRLKWDLKAFARLLVTSAAYRQSSKVPPELVQRDPDNRLLARGPRFRLSAEMVRDQALTASGLLSHKMYGPPVKPPQPASGLSAAFGSGIDWQTSMGEDKYRRGLYTTWRRSNPYPSMATFDAPNREVCTLRRVRTNTPLQALVTLNDPVYVEAAQALARKIVQQGGETSLAQAETAFQLCLTRPAKPQEAARVAALFEETRATLNETPAEALKLASEPLGPIPDGMHAVDLAAWTVVSNALLNLDEVLMKR